MKKTLLAISLAATVSAPALAWTNGTTGGSFEIGGTITPEAKPTQVWEAQLGTVSPLNFMLPNNTSTVTIPATNNIPVLGFRVADPSGIFAPVTGATNNPMISYGGKYNLSTINHGVGVLTLDVMDSANTKIGSLETKMSSAAVVSSVHKTVPTSSQYVSITAADKNIARGFSGGLGVDAVTAIPTATEALALVTQLFPEASTRFKDQGIASGTNGGANLNSSGNASYSGAYASGIVSGTDMKITLDKTLSSATVWKASLPITISYN